MSLMKLRRCMRPVRTTPAMLDHNRLRPCGEWVVTYNQTPILRHVQCQLLLGLLLRILAYLPHLIEG
jgi:hypothetical protein